MQLFQPLAETIKAVSGTSISADRQSVLQPLIEYVKRKAAAGEEACLQFVCTHNSRRSQLAQIWAQTFADYFGVRARCLSGGVEVTAFNERAVASLQRSGFVVTSERSDSANPLYLLRYDENSRPIRAFSKRFDDPENAAEAFAAVMVCSHADENCPFIPGTEQRIAVRYEDPKVFDGTPEEAARYDERSRQIASEMWFVFSQITQ